MDTLTLAVIAINLALVLYTVGVWSERIARTLKPWHVGFFTSGVVFDTIGTAAMSSLAGGLHLNLHSATGVLALVLMAIHTAWAAVALVRKRPKELRSFHRFSLLVWCFWLIPFALGAVLNSDLVSTGYFPS